METAMKILEVMMIGHMPEKRKLLRICGEIIKIFWQKEGCLTQMMIHRRNYLALVNGMRNIRVIKDEEYHVQFFQDYHVLCSIVLGLPEICGIMFNKFRIIKDVQ